MTKHTKTPLTELDFKVTILTDDFEVWDDDEYALDIEFSDGISNRLMDELPETGDFAEDDMDAVLISSGNFYLVYNADTKKFALSCHYEYYYDACEEDGLYGGIHTIQLTDKEEAIALAVVNDFCREKFGYMGYQDFSDYLMNEVEDKTVEANKQYVVSDAYSGNYCVMQYIDGKLKHYSFVAVHELSGHLETLKDNGYREAYFVEQYEREMQKAMEAYRCAEEAYKRAKRKPLLLDKAETERYKQLTFFEDNE